MITSNAPCSPPKLLYYSSTKILEQMKWSKMARARRWQRNFSIIDLAREWCRKNEGEGSFYTPRGKRKRLGSMPSVSLREIEQISRKGHTI